MKSVVYFFFYALAVFNVFVWMVMPDLLSTVMWKWDIFMVLLFAPLLYNAWNESK